MQIGAVFAHQEIGSDPIVFRDWTQTAEGLGYSESRPDNNMTLITRYQETRR